MNVVLFLLSVDSTDPVCTCGNTEQVTIPLNAGGTTVVFTPCTATDNSGSVSLTQQSHQPGQFFPTGTTRVEYTFTDPSGNSVNCGFNVIVTEGLFMCACF